MERSAGVSPIITLLSLLIGFKVAGIVGAMLSIPIIITINVLLEEVVFSPKK
jgi:predicted PurR-regulated permease PerM